MFKIYFYFLIYKVMDHTFAHFPDGFYIFLLIHKSSLRINIKEKNLASYDMNYHLFVFVIYLWNVVKFPQQIFYGFWVLWHI